MDSNRPNFGCQARELINKFEPRPGGVKGITQDIMGWELDEVGKRGGSTRLVRMGAGCETPEPRARRNARSVRTGQGCLLLEFAWHPDVSARSGK